MRKVVPRSEKSGVILFFTLFTIFGVLGVENSVDAIQNDYSNTLLKLDFQKAQGNNVKVDIVSSSPYKINISPVKKSDGEYVILLPETYHSITSKPDITSTSGSIQDVDVKLLPYVGSNSNNGYTKITIKTNPNVNLQVVNQVSKNNFKVENELLSIINEKSEKKPVQLKTTKPSVKKNVQVKVVEEKKNKVSKLAANKASQPKKIEQGTSNLAKTLKTEEIKTQNSQHLTVKEVQSNQETESQAISKPIATRPLTTNITEPVQPQQNVAVLFKNASFNSISQKLNNLQPVLWVVLPFLILILLLKKIKQNALSQNSKEFQSNMLHEELYSQTFSEFNNTKNVEAESNTVYFEDCSQPEVNLAQNTENIENIEEIPNQASNNDSAYLKETLPEARSEAVVFYSNEENQEELKDFSSEQDYSNEFDEFFDELDHEVAEDFDNYENYEDYEQEIELEEVFEFENSEEFQETVEPSPSSEEELQLAIEEAPTVLAQKAIEKDKTLFLVDHAGQKALIGIIDSGVFVLNKFQQEIEKAKILTKFNQKKNEKDVYLVQIDKWSALIGVSQDNMELLLEL